MKRFVLVMSGGILALGVAACSSAPTRFYTLIAPTSAPTRAVTAPAYQFELLPVSIPAQVDQPQLVIRQSDDRVDLLEGEQWIGPLGDQIRTALSDDLTQRLGAEDVDGLPHPKGQKVYRIKLDVRRFESVPGAYALISAAWSVRGTHNKQTLSCTNTVSQPVGAGYSALVQGHQQALAQLAAKVATSLQSLAAGNPACP